MALTPRGILRAGIARYITKKVIARKKKSSLNAISRSFSGVTVEVTGLEEFHHNIELTIRESRNLARSTVHGIAGMARDEMRKGAPKDSGTLRKAITAVRRSVGPDGPVSEVRVQHGKRAKHDAWYWHFQESRQPFVAPVVAAIRADLPRIYREEFGKKLEAMIRRKAKKARM